MIKLFVRTCAGRKREKKNTYLINKRQTFIKPRSITHLQYKCFCLPYIPLVRLLSITSSRHFFFLPLFTVPRVLWNPSFSLYIQLLFHSFCQSLLNYIIKETLFIFFLRGANPIGHKPKTFKPTDYQYRV